MIDDRPATGDALTGLDFRSIELVAVVKSLRAWGDCCWQLLSQRPPVAPIQADMLLALSPFLAPWFSSPAEPRRINRRLRRRLRHQPDEKRTVTQPVSLAIARHLGKGRLRERLLAPFGVYRPTPIHDAMWALFADLAWRSPGFQHMVATRIHAHLRTRALLGGRLPAPTLDPRTFWLLIDLLGVTQLRSRKLRKKLRSPLPRLTRFRTRARRRALGLKWRGSPRQLAQRLEEIVWTQVVGSRWAGFWEQWLIAELAIRQLDLVRKASPAALQMLAAVPWLREAARYKALVELLRETRRPKGYKPLQLATPDWRSLEPTWV
jgi:hypothetical protein